MVEAFQQIGKQFDLFSAPRCKVHMPALRGVSNIVRTIPCDVGFAQSCPRGDDRHWSMLYPFSLIQREQVFLMEYRDTIGDGFKIVEDLHGTESEAAL